MPTTLSTNILLSQCDRAYPATGVWGYCTLLTGNLALNLSTTANAATNQLTTASAHDLATGSRVRFSGGTLPTPLLANTDYYAIVSSTTVLSLATTLANANANTPIDLLDVGAGSLFLNEQVLNVNDQLSVLIKKEIAHASFPARLQISNLGAATIVGGIARKPDKILSISGGATPLSYRYLLFMESALAATATLGNVPPSPGLSILEDRETIDTIAPGDPPRAIFFRPQLRNP